ncbi:MAG: class I SAM-dependent methyltransferase [Clostridiaceae bacterium]|nr:class I SAM-dependent methyltransferase [Clostridiaceae bacterium]
MSQNPFQCFWETLWQREDTERLTTYLRGWQTASMGFLEIFKAHGVKSVCDAACGFGAMSLMLERNGFQVAGFDLSAASAALTGELLDRFGVRHGEYKAGDILDIPYNSAAFDGVVAHSVIDHLGMSDGRRALSELDRIIRPGGLIYLSFDAPEPEDESLPHETLEDGSYLYTTGERAGMLFHPYTDQEIAALCAGRRMILQGVNQRREREVILQKDQ